MANEAQKQTILRPIVARDPHEHHRAATPLELLYDLVLVIAVGAAAAGLHHAVNENHIGAGVFMYFFVFWTLWWPWMNFTWFASAYDNDDVLYRCLVFLQMIGALMTAVGIRDINNGIVTILPLAGYIVMRVGMIALWMRAANSHSAGRACAMRYAIGIAVCQIVWILWFILAPAENRFLFALPIMLLEMLVPAYAERTNPTPWHRHHIIERYGLLTIIVFGESLFSAASAIGAIAKDYTWNLELWSALVAGFIILFSMWWIYFGERYHSALDTFSGSLAWGYSHYFVFASAAAAGAGIAILVDQITHHSEISRQVANASIAIPVAVYLLSVWFVHDRTSAAHRKWQLPTFAVLILLTPLVGFGALLTAILLVVCLAMRIKEDNAA
ncbi:MAG: low temperature requirement protein A [Rhizobiaceae bacterium]